MDAVWYEKQGPARDVLVVGQMPDPEPGPGEVRIRVAASGINPGEVKKRQNAFGVGMPYPRVIPHSDGAGTIDRAGEGVSASRVGQRVWCHGAQSYRPFGTAAEYVVVAQAPRSGAASVGTACRARPRPTPHRTPDRYWPKRRIRAASSGPGRCRRCRARRRPPRRIDGPPPRT